MLGMKDIRRLLERWQLVVGDVRERMYRAPTPRERERWHGLWLLAHGCTALAVAEALEREPHTIGTWVASLSDKGPTAFEQLGGPPPRPRRRPAGPTEGCGAGAARKGRNRPGELELESGTEICPRTLRTLAEQQQLPELLASVGFCPEAAEETFSEGRRGQVGGLRGGVCRTPGRSATTGDESLLR